MLLHDDQDYSLSRCGRYLCAALKRPHRVLSSCPVNGGLREDLTHICNHQSCEGAGHAGRQELICGMGPDGYHQHACRQAGIPGATLLQNGVCAELRRSICGALGRHGCTDEALRSCARKELGEEAARLFEHNLLALIHDPQSAAAAYCLSENLTDGVLTPLWALCLFGLPGLILVKAVFSLDSMVGYKDERYRGFGWAAARSDDLVHWLPARLSVPLIALAAALLRLHPRLAISTARRWHGMLASPNSGWSEAACAGALRVRLIGPISYRGEVVNEAFLGEESWPADLDGRHLEQALHLILVCGLLALTFGVGLLISVGMG